MVKGPDVHFTRCSRCNAQVECVRLEDRSIIRLDPEPQRVMLRPHGNEIVQAQLVHSCRRS